ncbi:MAG: hypothetical protein V7K38_02250 [Nostoc sp.]|uniref:hypothetical protein n=1 Tax=Nostoc sp. TaxID=1180 RepID=UPI002FFABDA1
MNEKIDLNLTKAKQSSVEEEITESNDSKTDDITLNKLENDLMPESKAVLIAKDPGMNPPPPRPEFMSEVTV